MRNEILQGIFGGLAAIFVMVLIGSFIARGMSGGHAAPAAPADQTAPASPAGDAAPVAPAAQ